MKKTYKGILYFALIFMAMSSYSQDKPKPKMVFVKTSDSTQVLNYSLEVMQVIDSKCFGCHQPNARNEKARKALIWEDLQTMDESDLVAALDEIIEVLDEGEMPPKKLVEKYPNMKMSEDETTTLKTWAESKLNELMNE